MSRLLKTEAIVLARKTLLGKDILITLLTRELGKMKIIAKGMKKITSRRAAHMQTGNLVRVELYKSQDTYYLQQSQLLSGFTQIKNDLHKIDTLYKYFFILNRVLPELQLESSVYIVVRSFLVELSRSREFNPNNFSKYLYDTLRILGYIKEKKSFIELMRLTEETINEKIPHVL